MKLTEKERQNVWKSLEELDAALATLCRNIQGHGRTDLVEICCPADSELAKTIENRGGTAVRMGLWNDFHFAKKGTVGKAKKYILEHRPKRIHASPPCPAAERQSTVA